MVAVGDEERYSYANVESEMLYENVSSVKEAVYIKEGPTVYDPQIPPTLPVPVDSLSHHVATCHANDNTLFKEQYQVYMRNYYLIYLLFLTH